MCPEPLSIDVMISLLRLSLLYFLVVFAAGFALGTIRVLFLVEAIGERYAELAETPLMAIVCALAAHYFINQHRDILTLQRTLFMGVISLALLLTVEFSVVLNLRGLTLDQYVQSRDPVSGIAYIAGLLWYAIAPSVFYVSSTKSQRDPDK